MSYRKCPKCGADGVMIERRINGRTKCANGHMYPSSPNEILDRAAIFLIGLLLEEKRGTNETINY